MIELTKLNGAPITVNIDLIETVEETPDTVLTFASGKKIVVKECTGIIISKSVEYKKRIVCD